MKKTRQILAIIGIVLLVLLYAATLFFALTENPNSMRMFAASMVATVVIPVFIWVINMFMKMGRDRSKLNNEVAAGKYIEPADTNDNHTEEK